MKTTNLKWVVYALSALLLMNSCTVYNKTPVSVDDAIATKKSVKVYTEENETYEFNKLVKEKENIYGIIDNYGSNKQTRLRVELASYIKEIDTEKGLAKILLPFEIKEVYTKNKTKSILSFWPLYSIIIFVTLGLVGMNS